MTAVNIEETPGGTEPLAKAQGNVLGFQTQLDDALAHEKAAQARVNRVQQENEERLANAHDASVRATAEVARLQGELATAEAELATMEA